MNRLIATLAIVGAIGLAMATPLEWLPHDVSTSAIHGALQLLDRLERADARWDLEIYKARSDSAVSYDVLADTSNEIDAVLGELARERDRIDALEQGLPQLSRTFAVKAQLLEDFKSEQAILRNTQSYIPFAARELDAFALERHLDGQFTRWINAALTHSLLYSRRPTVTDAAEIAASLARLDAGAAGHDRAFRDRVDNFAMHLEGAMSRQVRTTELLERLREQPVQADIDAVKAALVLAQGRSDQMTAGERRLMRLLTACLAVGLTAAAFLFVRSQRASARLRRELQDLYDHAPCGYHSVDQDGIVQRMNATELAWLGYTADEVIGKMHVTQLFDSGFGEQFSARFAEFKRSGVLDNLEAGLLRKDGSRLFVSANATAVTDPSGRFLMSRTTLFDVTARREAEAASRRTAVFMDAVIENIPVPILVKDARTRQYVRLNQAAEELLGMPRDRVLGRTPDSLVPPELARHHHARDLAVLEKNQLIEFPPMLTTLPDGRQRMLRTAKTVIPDENGQPLYLLAINEDLTEILEVNAELERKTSEADAANRAKSAFLATMSHEIRTPMNGVLAMAEILRTTELTPEQADLAQLIEHSSHALLAVIEDILDFSKIEAGKLELELIECDLRSAFEGAIEALTSSACQSGVELLMFWDPASPERGVTDPTRLRQILTNLCGNAIKFSRGLGDRPGSVVVQGRLVRCTDEQVCVAISVTDNGIGMHPDTVAGLFRPFVQAESSTTRRYGGSGLGLTISQRIAQAMGTSIAVHSEAGQGSCFSIELAMGRVESPAAPQPAPLAGLQVLSMATGTLADIVDAYGSCSGASVRRFESCPQLAAWLGDHDGTNAIIVSDDRPESEAALQAMLATLSADAIAGRLRLTTGMRRAAAVAQDRQLTLDRCAIRRAALIDALLVAAGRMSLKQPTTTPAVRSDSPLASVAQAEEAGRLVLVVDDHPSNRKVLRQQLGVLGFTCETATNGVEALERCANRKYGLVLTDCHMPSMDGFTLTRSLRAREVDASARLPIVAVTANAMKDEQRRCLDAGMDDFLTKPIPLSRLREVLDRWLPGLPSTPGVPASVGSSGLPDEQPPISRRALADILGTDDRAILDEFVEDFVANGAQMTTLLRAALSCADLPALKGHAHRFKSSARAVGAMRTSALCERIEAACEARDTATLVRCVQAFSDEQCALQDWIEVHEF